MPCLRALRAALSAALLAACGSDEPADFPEAPTYYRDVKPIVDAKCVSCHDGAGIAPFSLRSYQDLVPVQGLVRTVVSDRRMPPWLPGPECTEYAGDRSLDDAQIATMTKWVDAGAPAGDPGETAPPLDGGGFELSRVDRTLAMPTAYQAVATDADDYRCFVLDWPETATSYVTGFRVAPGAIRFVHHVIAFLATPEQAAAVQELDEADAGPGYSCYAGPVAAAGWLGVWTPGSGGADFPEGTGIKVEPGSKVVMQVHYSALNGTPEPDQSAIELRLDSTVAKEAWIQPWTDPSWYGEGGMLIPAGDTDVTYSSSFDAPLFVSNGQPFLMHSVGLHMHALGTSGRLDIRRADGTTECLLDIPRWDPHWQSAYGLAKPRRIESGDYIVQECHWDNGADHQIVANGKLLPPKDVDWGESVRDEMCLAAFYLSTP